MNKNTLLYILQQIPEEGRATDPSSVRWYQVDNGYVIIIPTVIGTVEIHLHSLGRILDITGFAVKADNDTLKHLVALYDLNNEAYALCKLLGVVSPNVDMDLSRFTENEKFKNDHGVYPTEYLAQLKNGSLVGIVNGIVNHLKTAEYIEISREATVTITREAALQCIVNMFGCLDVVDLLSSIRNRKLTASGTGFFKEENGDIGIRLEFSFGHITITRVSYSKHTQYVVMMATPNGKADTMYDWRAVKEDGCIPVTPARWEEECRKLLSVEVASVYRTENQLQTNSSMAG